MTTKYYPKEKIPVDIKIGSDPEKNLLLFDFNQPVRWLAIEPAIALDLATKIASKAMEMMLEKNKGN